MAHTTQVLILQHPLEVDHAKNTARLLHLSLQHSQLWVGETFSTEGLHAALQGPAANVLLYPRFEVPRAAQPSASTADAPSARPHPPGTPLRLVVLDGTWRKSRLMLYRNPVLQTLPRLSLDGAPAGAYGIRKAHKPGQLSTLEATCAALAQLEHAPARFAPLLAAFKGFVAQQAAFNPARADGVDRMSV